MVSRGQLIVVITIITLGLLGPVSFIAEEAAKNKTPIPTITPSPSHSFVMTQVREYEANVTADIIEVQPIIAAVIGYNASAEEMNAILSNFTNCTLIRVEGEGVFNALFSLNDPMDYGMVIFQIESANMSLLNYGMPAEIKLPDSFTAMRNGKEYTLTMNPNDSVHAVVSGITQSGSTEFYLKITDYGGKKTIIATELV